MFRPTNPDRQRNLYQMFRDSLLEDCIRSGIYEVELWRSVPKENIGRLQTVSLIRKMASRMSREFPGALTLSGGKLKISHELVDFSKTHRDLGSSEDEAIQAWQAMQSM